MALGEDTVDLRSRAGIARDYRPGEGEGRIHWTERA